MEYRLFNSRQSLQTLRRVYIVGRAVAFGGSVTERLFQFIESK